MRGHNLTKAASEKLDEVTAIDGPAYAWSEVLSLAEKHRQNDTTRKRFPIIAQRHILAAVAELEHDSEVN